MAKPNELGNSLGIEDYEIIDEYASNLIKVFLDIKNLPEYSERLMISEDGYLIPKENISDSFYSELILFYSVQKKVGDAIDKGYYEEIRDTLTPKEFKLIMERIKIQYPDWFFRVEIDLKHKWLRYSFARKSSLV